MENSAKRKIKRGNGFLLTRKSIFYLGAFFLASIIAVGLLVYFLAPHKTETTPISLMLVGGKDFSNVTAATIALANSTMTNSARLPDDVLPLSYAVQLQPYLVEDNFTFQGHVEILIECKRRTKWINLHALGLNILKGSVKLVNSEGQSLAVGHPTYNGDKQFLVFKLEEKLMIDNKYTLAMDFTGNLTASLAGFYRSKYGNKWMATTQFSPTDARRAFPCFDEPGFKAVFNVTLIRQQGMISLSNMPLMNSTANLMSDGWVKDQFYPTKKMSTYLLAFIVTDFDYIEKNSTGVRFRIYARKEAVSQTSYALKIGPEILKFYGEFFKIPYPLPKLDMIAVHDMGPSAMENWGLITYREAKLLFDPRVASNLDRQLVAIITGHELAHQWFGNLVTPLWWEDLWLKEGFATYVGCLGVDKVHPEWKMLDQFVVNNLHIVFKMDALKSLHPVFVPVDNPDKIYEIFDAVSYRKGASITRMMHHYLGDDVFLTGLKNYLLDKQFSNAVQDELWDHLSKAAAAKGESDVNVKTVMDTWTLQTGYPVVHVKRNSDGTIMLNQTRFLLVRDNTVVKNAKWEIPVTFTSASAPDFSNTKPVAWLHQDGEPVTLSKGVPHASSWVIVNVKQTGFYRVNYDIDNWKLIIDQLNTNHLTIDATNRAQIINDAFNLARAGLLHYDIALSTTRYLAKETDYVPFSAAYDTLSYVDIMLSKTGAYGKWKKYMLSIIQPLFYNFTFEQAKREREEDWKDGDHLPSLTRSFVMMFACKLGMKECIDASMAAFLQWKNSNVSISPNLKRTAICTVLQESDIDEWEFVWSQYLSSNVGSEKVMLLAALGCTTKPWILLNYLNMTLNADKIRPQDVSTVIGAVAKNKVGRYLAYNFVRDKWTQLHDKFKTGLFSLERILSSAFANLNTPLELQELLWFKKNREGSLGLVQKALLQVIEETQANIQWMNTYYSIVEEWLNRQTIQ